MLTRILTAIVALLIFVPILVWGGSVGVSAAFAVICGISVFEMLGCCGLRKHYHITVPSILLCALAVIIPLLETLGCSYGGFGVGTVLLVGVLYYAVVSVFSHKSIDPDRLFMALALLLYVTAGFYSVAFVDDNIGIYVLIYILLISWGTDTFAYFTGMAFGKKKLCPSISPKKTVAGAIGGTICGGLLGCLLIYFLDGHHAFMYFAIPLSVLSQLGDLAASVIKRKFGVKDYGKLFPGHGGMLDRFDSVIAVAIATYVISLFLV